MNLELEVRGWNLKKQTPQKRQKRVTERPGSKEMKRWEI